MQAEERNSQLTAVAHALTEAERAMFLGKVARKYPRLDGAHVDDVLDITTDHDMFLDKTEPFYERFGAQLPETGAVTFALHVIILMGWTLTPGRVWSILQRAGVVEAPRYPEVEAGLWVHERDLGGGPCRADANGLLLTARAEQGMRAAGIPESEITEFRRLVRHTEDVRFSHNVADIAAWVTLVDRFTAMPRKVYDPTDDIAVVLAWLKMHGVDAPVRPAMDNLHSHLDMRSAETIKSSLSPFYGREA
jgi:hypothetical protein